MKNYLFPIGLLGMLALSSCKESSSAGEELKENVNDALDRRPGEKVKDAMEDAADAAEDAGKEIKDGVKDAAEEIKDKVNEVTE